MMRRSREKRFGSATPRLSVAAEVQSLESRSLPTGTVTASLSNGNLTIGGDNLDNSILIEVRTTGIFLTGLPDAQSDPVTFTKIKFAGVTYEAGEEVQLTDTLSLNSLTLLMRGGNDKVRMEIGVAATDPEPDAPAVAIAGRLRINLGQGNDHGVLLLNNGTLTIGGNLEGDLDNGDDCLVVGPAEALSEGDSAIPDPLPINVGGNIIVLGRLGQDVITMAGIEAQRSVTLLGGDHADSISVIAATVHGNLSINGNRGDDDLLLALTSVAGTTTIRGESGNDQVVIAGVESSKDVTVYLGSGDDQLAVAGLTVDDETDRITFDGGTGNDSLMSAEEVTDPPIKLRSIEDAAAQLDVEAIIDSLVSLTNECLDAPAPPIP